MEMEENNRPLVDEIFFNSKAYCFGSSDGKVAPVPLAELFMALHFG